MANLSPYQKATYLANVLSVARTDGKAGPAEGAALKEVVAGLDADPDDLKAARALLGDGRYQIKLLPDFSTRARNIEDMLLMALSDSELSERETAPIKKIADACGYSQADLDMILRRAELRLNKLGNLSAAAAGAGMTFDSPGGKAAPAPLPAAETAPSMPPEPPKGAKTPPPPPPPRRSRAPAVAGPVSAASTASVPESEAEVPKLTQAILSQADTPPLTRPIAVTRLVSKPRELSPGDAALPAPAEAAKRAEPRGHDRLPDPTVAAPQRPAADPSPACPDRGLAIVFAGDGAEDLLSLARRWSPSADAGLSGRGEARRWYLSWPGGRWSSALPLAAAARALPLHEVYVDGVARDWDSVFGWRPCAAARAASACPECWCFGTPPTELNPWGCRLAGMPWNAWAPWFSLGRFRDGLTFVFDREAIRKRLMARLQPVLACPHLSAPYVEAALEALPSRACALSRWRYRPAAPHATEAQTLRVRELIHGCPVARIRRLEGVAPVGVAGALAVIRRAARRAGTYAVDTRRLAAGAGQPQPLPAG